MSTEEREVLAKVLAEHHPTRGMSVSMGTTCECGYWTGSESESGKRPLPWGRDSLDLHRADVVAALTAKAKAEAWDEGWIAGCDDQQYGDDDARPWTPNPHNADRETP